MKNIRLILAIFATAVTIVSCSKDNVLQETGKPSEEEQPSKHPGVLTAIVENTKTYLVPDSAEETSYNVVWNNKDKISTLQNSNQGIYITNCEDGSSSATFTYESGAPVSPGTFDAYYPSETVQNGTLVWPERQKYREYAGGPMVSAGNNADAKGNATLRFTHLGGVIRFKLNTTEEFKVKSAMMTATEPLSGTFTVNEGKAEINASSGIVVLDFDNSVTVDATNTGVFCFSVPEGNYSNLAFYFLGENGKMVIAKKTSGALSITRGVVTKISASGVTPALSTEQGSNCFIFYNGDAPININLMGEYHSGTWIPLALGGAASAEVVWESDCTIVDEDKAKTVNSIISSVSYSNGTLNIIPTGNGGNAVVAVKDNTGTVIWSYHIWIPSTKIVDITYNSNTFMDRDLGVRAVPTGKQADYQYGGTYYQKGRKDPIPGHSFQGNGNYSIKRWYITAPSNPDHHIVTTVYTLDTKDNPSVENTIQNLLTLYKNPCSDLSWQKDGNKSINDPCPEGYRVPQKEEMGLLPGGYENYHYYRKVYTSISNSNTGFTALRGYGYTSDKNNITTGSAWYTHVSYWAAEGDFQCRASEDQTMNSWNPITNNLASAIRCIKETASN